ncbi:MAG: thioredoxin family protein [Flavobacteriales bacterium]
MKKIFYFLLALSFFVSCQDAEVKTLTNDSVEGYQNFIANKKLVLVDFNATWCAPCRKLSPILDEIAAEKGDALNILKINTDAYPIISEAMHIDGIPALVLYKDGKEVWNGVGLRSKEELTVLINEHLQ